MEPDAVDAAFIGRRGRGGALNNSVYRGRGGGAVGDDDDQDMDTDA